MQIEDQDSKKYTKKDILKLIKKNSLYFKRVYLRSWYCEISTPSHIYKALKYNIKDYQFNKSNT